MKTPTESTNDKRQNEGQTQSIICGGGWKTPPKEYQVKINAICGAFLTIAAALLGSVTTQPSGRLDLFRLAFSSSPPFCYSGLSVPPLFLVHKMAITISVTSTVRVADVDKSTAGTSPMTTKSPNPSLICSR